MKNLFQKQGIRSQDRALAAVSIMARMNRVVSLEMLKKALSIRFHGDTLESALTLVDKVALAV